VEVNIKHQIFSYNVGILSSRWEKVYWG